MQPYSELLQNYGSRKAIPYAELLTTIEWNNKRKIIVERDRRICGLCGCRETLYENGNHWWVWEEDVKKEMMADENTFEEITDSELYSSKSDKPYTLHVYHNYYVLSVLPWEYSDNALVTLCNWCHWKFHIENRVSIYETFERSKLLNYTPCRRCNGAGVFPEYSHIQNGICFNCEGKKFEELILF